MSTGQSNEPGSEKATPNANFEPTAIQNPNPDSSFWLPTENPYDLGPFVPTAITKGDHLVDDKQMLDDLTYFLRRFDSIESVVDMVLHRVFENQLVVQEGGSERSEFLYRTYRFLTQIVALGIYSDRAGGISQYERQIAAEKKAARKSRRKAS
jgi:hypothetical protein